MLVCGLVLACGVASASLSDGLVAYWTLDEGSGATTALDSVGTYDGAITGGVTTGVAGIIGGAYSFDGTGYVDVAQRVTELGDASWSFSAWVRTATDGGAILGKCDGDGTWEYREKRVYVSNSTSTEEAPRGSVNLAARGGEWVSGSAVVTDGAWHHVALTWDSSSGTGLVYVDGAEGTSYDGYTGLADRNAHTVRIGFTPGGGSTTNYVGLLDDVRIYNRVLSASEVTDLNALGSGTYPPLIMGLPPHEGYVGITYSHTFTAPAEPPPVFSLADEADLPDGLGWDAPTGTISGTPTAAAVSPWITVTAANGQGSDAQQFRITVVEPGDLHLRVNSGSNSYDVAGWERDDAYASGGQDYIFSQPADTSGVANAAPVDVYRSCRHTSPGGSYSYDYAHVPNGTYTVRLHFYDEVGSAREMDYTMEGVKVLDGFAPAVYTVTVRDFTVTVSDGDGLQILVEADTGDDAFECGVEVIAVPSPEPTIAVSDAAAGEADGAVTVVVTMTGTSASTVTVDYATQDDTAKAPGDYVSGAGTLTWTAGQSGAKTFTVAITDDTVAEGTETFRVGLSNASGATITDGQAAVTIADDDPAAPPGAFELLYPADGGTGVPIAPTLDWADAAGAETYALVVSADLWFTVPVVQETALESSSYGFAPGALEPETTYYWRVTAANPWGSTPASNNDFSFTTAAGVPAGSPLDYLGGGCVPRAR